MGAAELAELPAPPGPPGIVAQLVTKGLDTLVQETNLCRVPIFCARALAGDLMIPPSTLYKVTFRQLAGRALTEADHRIYSDILSRWIRSGCPDDLRVRYTLADAARAVGWTADSGETRRFSRESLTRLKTATYESCLRAGDGAEAIYQWSPLDAVVLVRRRGRRDGRVQISFVVADLVLSGAVTWLHAPTWDTLRERDGLAARLWTFLEAESLKGTRNYSIFAEADAPRSLPAIADLLGLHQRRHLDTARRIARASEAIEACDHRYSLSVVAALGGDKWHLEAKRARGRAGLEPGEAITTDPSGLPTAVMTAWRRAYSGRRPSTLQIERLGELATRWEPAELSAMIQSVGEGDPLARAMAVDRERSRSQLAAADAREREVEREHGQDEARALSFRGALAARGMRLPDGLGTGRSAAGDTPDTAPSDPPRKGQFHRTKGAVSPHERGSFTARKGQFHRTK